MTLYELSIQFQTILEMAEDGEIDMDVVNGSLECVEADIEQKLDSYGVVINELSNDIENIEKEIKRLTERKRTIDNNITRMKGAIKDAMEAIGKKKIQGNKFTWTIAKNGGKRPVIMKEGVNILEIPERFQDWTVKPDREQIREALENGEELDFATLGERGESLRLR